MILDTIDHAQAYFAINERLTAALRYLAKTDCTGLAPGTHEIRGRRIFAMAQDYITTPPQDKRWEAHHNYIDVQFVASGIEDIGYAPLAMLNEIQPYDADKDVAFYDGEGWPVRVPAGSFVILFPHDAHKPGLIAVEAAKVRKVVVKVAVS
jgi:YhcH/YjgK/YiaL family protein